VKIGNSREATGNSKRINAFALGVLLFGFCMGAEAQATKKLHRVGFITTGFPASIAHLLEGFK
jgi:hypothetical protein